MSNQTQKATLPLVPDIIKELFVEDAKRNDLSIDEYMQTPVFKSFWDSYSKQFGSRIPQVIAIYQAENNIDDQKQEVKSLPQHSCEDSTIQGGKQCNSMIERSQVAEQEVRRQVAGENMQRGSDFEKSQQPLLSLPPMLDKSLESPKVPHLAQIDQVAGQEIGGENFGGGGKYQRIAGNPGKNDASQVLGQRERPTESAEIQAPNTGGVRGLPPEPIDHCQAAGQEAGINKLEKSGKNQTDMENPGDKVEEAEKPQLRSFQPYQLGDLAADAPPQTQSLDSQSNSKLGGEPPNQRCNRQPAAESAPEIRGFNRTSQSSDRGINSFDAFAVPKLGEEPVEAAESQQILVQLTKEEVAAAFQAFRIAQFEKETADLKIERVRFDAIQKLMLSLPDNSDLAQILEIEAEVGKQVGFSVELAQDQLMRKAKVQTQSYSQIEGIQDAQSKKFEKPVKPIAGQYDQQTKSGQKDQPQKKGEFENAEKLESELLRQQPQLISVEDARKLLFQRVLVTNSSKVADLCGSSGPLSELVALFIQESEKNLEDCCESLVKLVFVESQTEAKRSELRKSIEKFIIEQRYAVFAKMIEAVKVDERIEKELKYLIKDNPKCDLKQLSEVVNFEFELIKLIYTEFKELTADTACRLTGKELLSAEKRPISVEEAEKLVLNKIIDVEPVDAFAILISCCRQKQFDRTKFTGLGRLCASYSQELHSFLAERQEQCQVSFFEQFLSPNHAEYCRFLVRAGRVQRWKPKHAGDSNERLLASLNKQLRLEPWFVEQLSKNTDAESVIRLRSLCGTTKIDAMTANALLSGNEESIINLFPTAKLFARYFENNLAKIADFEAFLKIAEDGSLVRKFQGLEEAQASRKLDAAVKVQRLFESIHLEWKEAVFLEPEAAARLAVRGSICTQNVNQSLQLLQKRENPSELERLTLQMLQRLSLPLIGYVGEEKTGEKGADLLIEISEVCASEPGYAECVMKLAANKAFLEWKQPKEQLKKINELRQAHQFLEGKLAGEWLFSVLFENVDKTVSVAELQREFEVFDSLKTLVADQKVLKFFDSKGKRKTWFNGNLAQKLFFINYEATVEKAAEFAALVKILDFLITQLDIAVTRDDISTPDRFVEAVLCKVVADKGAEEKLLALARWECTGLGALGDALGRSLRRVFDNALPEFDEMVGQTVRLIANAGFKAHFLENLSASEQIQAAFNYLDGRKADMWLFSEVDFATVDTCGVWTNLQPPYEAIQKVKNRQIPEELFKIVDARRFEADSSCCFRNLNPAQALFARAYPLDAGSALEFVSLTQILPRKAELLKHRDLIKLLMDSLKFDNLKNVLQFLAQVRALFPYSSFLRYLVEQKLLSGFASVDFVKNIIDFHDKILCLLHSIQVPRASVLGLLCNAQQLESYKCFVHQDLAPKEQDDLTSRLMTLQAMVQDEFASFISQLIFGKMEFSEPQRKNLIIIQRLDAVSRISAEDLVLYSFKEFGQSPKKGANNVVLDRLNFVMNQLDLRLQAESAAIEVYKARTGKTKAEEKQVCERILVDLRDEKRFEDEVLKIAFDESDVEVLEFLLSLKQKFESYQGQEKGGKNENQADGYRGKLACALSQVVVVFGAEALEFRNFAKNGSILSKVADQFSQVFKALVSDVSINAFLFDQFDVLWLFKQLLFGTQNVGIEDCENALKALQFDQFDLKRSLELLVGLRVKQIIQNSPLKEPAQPIKTDGSRAIKYSLDDAVAKKEPQLSEIVDLEEQGQLPLLMAPEFAKLIIVVKGTDYSGFSSECGVELKLKERKIKVRISPDLSDQIF